jgi:hypothetical protein
MYLYFLPIPGEFNSQIVQDLPKDGETEVQVPTSDGGLEVTEARFLPPSEWLQLAQKGDIIMFPPQFFLLHLISQFVQHSTPEANPSKEELGRQRSELLRFVYSGTPPWTDKYMCPKPIMAFPDGRVTLALDYLGPELEGSSKQGEVDRVVVTRFTKEGPREVEVRWRKEVLEASDDPKSNL